MPATGASPQTAALYAWGRLCIDNVERLVAWLVIWPAAHLAMIGILLALGFSRGPTHVVAPVEIIPAGMLVWSLPRASYTFRRTERISKALDAARLRQDEAPPWAERLDWRYGLMRGSDWEIAIVAVIAALFIALPR